MEDESEKDLMKSPVLRSLAAVAASGLVAAGAVAGAEVSHAAEATAPKKVKVVKIAAKAFPVLLDRPGATADVLRVTRLAGADWFVGTSTEAVKFEATAKVAEVKVTGETTVTVKPAAETATNTFALSGPTSFVYQPTDAGKVFTDAEVRSELSWTDYPGTKSDAVTLTKVNGIMWKIGNVKYDELKFGKKTSLLVRLKAGEKVVPDYVGATGPDLELREVNDDATLAYTADQLKADVTKGDNPSDATKGVGKGASLETVKITGLPGVSWIVGSNPKAVNVKAGVTSYLPVSPHDIDASNKVNVTPVVAANYTVPTSGTPAQATPVEVDFTDNATDTVVKVESARSLSETDRSGTPQDTLVLPGSRGMSWFAGQKDAKGKLTYKQLRAGKDGNAVYKVKHGKDGKDAVVYYRAVADRGYTVNDGSVLEASFKVAETSVAAPSVAAGVVTLDASTDGVASWVVSATVNSKVAKTTYKPLDLQNAGIVSLTVPATVVEVKLVKGYKKG